jgi:isopenicillin N synthase-like dioxygenase
MSTQTVPEALTAPAQAFNNAPPFPEDVPTAPLLRLSLAKLIARDADEVQRFARACEDLGFFYLDLTGPGDTLLADADQLFEVGEELFDLPLEEKKSYDFTLKNSYFGYKGYGANVVDRSGNLDRNEFYNVRGAEPVDLDSPTDLPFLCRYPKTTCSASPSPYPPLGCSLRDVSC